MNENATFDFVYSNPGSAWLRAVKRDCTPVSVLCDEVIRRHKTDGPDLKPIRSTVCGLLIVPRWSLWLPPGAPNRAFTTGIDCLVQ